MGAAHAASSARHAKAQLVHSDLAFVRFVAGMRALLAALGATVLLAGSMSNGRTVVWLFLPYLVWCAWLLWKTLNGWPRATSTWWLWIDAAVLLAVCELIAPDQPMMVAITVLPVITVSLLAGARPALALAAVCASWVLMQAGLAYNMPARESVPLGVSVALLAFGPAAVLLTRPNRLLRRKLQALDSFAQQSDPRQGLRHHVHVLLSLIGEQLGGVEAVIHLQGLEPRVFYWCTGHDTLILNPPEAKAWQERMAALPQDMACVSGRSAAGEPWPVHGVDPLTGKEGPIPDTARAAMHALGARTFSLPLLTYGKPEGQLFMRCSGDGPAFEDVHWLNDVMREVLPLLERSDLLEQLQRETAARERERIGRDLHDSAVQPYLGLKYGLEALARQARADNPIRPQIQQLLELATAELQTLRDVVSGLRSGRDPNDDTSAPLAALHRQVARFQSLYGLTVHIFAPQAPELRGSAAKAILHMVNEALTNVRRHTSATGVTILLDVRDGNVVLSLRNDHGPGEALPAEFLPRSLSERAADFGGSVEVAHESDFTEISIRLPLLGAVA